MSESPVVLYVEDDPNSRIVLKMVLTARMNINQVIAFEDSKDFLARVERLQPHPNIIFLDIHVKPFDGFEMLKRLREHDQFQTTPVVALTASVMSNEIQELMDAGFDGCVAKPIDMHTFPTTFNRILSGDKVWWVIN